MKLHLIEDGGTQNEQMVERELAILEQSMMIAVGEQLEDEMEIGAED